MTRYAVIESTPGYLPDGDDPLVTGDYASAVTELNRLAAEYEDDPDVDYTVTYGVASRDNLAAVTVSDPTKIHDLGRIIEIVIDEEEL